MDFGDIARLEIDLEDILPEEALAGKLGDLLASQDRLLVLRSGPPPHLVTLGVPHHIAIGADQLCRRRIGPDGLPQPRDGDENAASYALVAYHALNKMGVSVSLVIMAHATSHDPNKLPDSPYCREIFARPTRLLLECHGSGRQRHLDLEVSAGRNDLADPVRFARALLRAAQDINASIPAFTLGAQTRPGQRSAHIWKRGQWSAHGTLELPAYQTLSLIRAGERGIPALHLEARPLFRRPAAQDRGLSLDGLLLGKAIAHATLAYFGLSEVQPH